MDWHGSWVAVASLEFDGKRAEEQKGLPFPGRRGGGGSGGKRVEGSHSGLFLFTPDTFQGTRGFAAPRCDNV